MSEEQAPRASGDWIFTGFIVGVALGASVGLFVWHEWATLKARVYWEVTVAFWALLGGVLGLAFGFAHRFLKKRPHHHP